MKQNVTIPQRSRKKIGVKSPIMELSISYKKKLFLSLAKIGGFSCIYIIPVYPLSLQKNTIKKIHFLFILENNFKRKGRVTEL